MRCFARMVSGMKGSLFNTNCHEWAANFREYFYFLTLISRKPQMTLITRIILSTEFKLIAQNFASRCALARRLKPSVFLFARRERRLTQKYALTLAPSGVDLKVAALALTLGLLQLT